MRTRRMRTPGGEGGGSRQPPASPQRPLRAGTWSRLRCPSAPSGGPTLPCWASLRHPSGCGGRGRRGEDEGEEEG